MSGALIACLVTNPFRVSVSPTEASVEGSGPLLTTNTVTAVIEPPGSYAVSWERVSGHVFTVLGQDTEEASFRTTNPGSGVDVDALYRCVGSNGSVTLYSEDVPVSARGI